MFTYAPSKWHNAAHFDTVVHHNTQVLSYLFDLFHTHRQTKEMSVDDKNKSPLMFIHNKYN